MLVRLRKALILAAVAAYLATIVGGHALHDLVCPCDSTVSCEHAAEHCDDHGYHLDSAEHDELAVAACHAASGHDADNCPICHLLAQAPLPGLSTVVFLPAEPVGYRAPAAIVAPTHWPTVLYAARAPPDVGLSC